MCEAQLQEELQEMMKTKDSRLKLIRNLSRDTEENWQNVVLEKEWVVEGMFSQIENQSDHVYAVLFNLEFVEFMVYVKGILPDQIIFVADNDSELGYAKGIYGVKKCIKVVNKTVSSVYNSLREKMPKTDKLIIVGNPPYQSMDTNGTSSVPIYQLFVEEALKLNPKYLSLIIPSRWFAGGRGLEDFRKKMMNDKHIRSITHFSDAKQIFPDVAISGGVNYFLWDRDYQGECVFNGETRSLGKHDIVITCNQALSVIEKILAFKIRFMNNVVFSTGYFGIREHTAILCQQDDPRACLCFFHGKRTNYISNWRDNKAVVDKWKVAISNTGNYSSQIDENSKPAKGMTNVFILKPKEICTDTYIIANVFDTEDQAKNFQSYLKTKFVRFLVGIRNISIHTSKKEFCFVPDPGSCDKIWTDEALYKMFKLTEEEIAFIESKIK